MSFPAAKTASARALLALAVAASLITGCGGGSSEQGSQTTSASAAAQDQGAAQPNGGAAPDSTSSAGSNAAPGAAPGGADADSPGATGGQGQGQKQGPRIAAPKGKVEQGPTPEELAQATVADISLQSPAIVAADGNPGTLAPTYTCDGKDSWPAFDWAGVPAGTAELILYAMNVQPLEGKLFVDWAVAGLDPGLTGIEAGKLPKGAIVGTNGFGQSGYSLCPQAGGEIYMFALYALPRSLELRRGFDAREVRKEILDLSGNVGLLPAIYARG